MKDYGSYLDRVAVDSALHDRIMRRVSRQRRSLSVGVRRLVTAVACIALLVMGIWATDGPGQLQGQSLFFNRAAGFAPSNKRDIPGYFTEALSAAEGAELLGRAWQRLEGLSRLSAVAGFDGEGVLDSISIVGEQSDSGQVLQIILTGGPVVLDYSYPEEPQPSEVSGVAVTAGYWEGSGDGVATVYYASFEHGPTGYYLELIGDQNAAEQLTTWVSLLIESGPAVLTSIQPESIPEWRRDELTLAEAKADLDFGQYMPSKLPAGFALESAVRFVSQGRDGLRASYHSGMKYVEWTIRRATEDDLVRMADVDDPKTYDLSLYPIPRAQSVPEALRAVVDCPVFQATELTLSLVQARAYTVEDAGDVGGPRMRFGVLLGEVLIEVRVKGAPPEDVFAALMEATD